MGSICYELDRRIGVSSMAFNVHRQYCVLILVCVSLNAQASNQPYIDQIKKDLKEKEETEVEVDETVRDPFLQSVKRKLEKEQPDPLKNQSYTEILKQADPNQNESPSDETYIEAEKAKLGPKEEGGAILAVLEGKSELKQKKKGNVHHAFGLRYGVSMSRTITSSIQARDFNSVYGGNYVPDLTLFYEYQPFHSEWFGNFGIFGMGSIAYFSGIGQFTNPVTKPGGTLETFPVTSQTKFQFFIVPVTVGVNYRFNLARIIRPYIFAGPTIINYVELRNDKKGSYGGASYGVTFTTGAAISLDWLSEAWELYATHGVQHYYLTVDYSLTNTFAGPVTVQISGILAGLTFEY